MESSGQDFKSKQDGLLFGDLSFAITAAHELKSPLALIRQLSLALDMYEHNEAERERIVRQIILTSERALRLTTDLTKASRLEDSLFDVEPLNPQQICEEVAHELAPLYEAKGKEIKVAARRRPLLVVANRELLRRIILSFGDNALHYSGHNAPVELRASSFDNGNKIRVGVRDYGPAVTSDVWRQLQSNLGKGAQVLHSRPQSSGLGLYIAGQFAQAMEAEIGATRHNDGATFYVDLTASTQMSLL